MSLRALKIFIKKQSGGTIKFMLNAIYLILALAAVGVAVWQIGFLFGIPGAPAQPDMTIALSALTAAIIFFGLWLAGRVHKEELKSRVMFD
jgi:nitrate reductase NapE component